MGQKTGAQNDPVFEYIPGPEPELPDSWSHVPPTSHILSTLILLKSDSTLPTLRKWPCDENTA